MADDDYEYINEGSIDPSLLCTICFCAYNDPYSTACRHIYCRKCIDNSLKIDNRCCVCRTPIRPTDLTRAQTICDAVNQLIVTCKRCDQNVQRGQFNEHIRNHCSGTRLDSSSGFSSNNLTNTKRIEALLNQPLRECQKLREELRRQRNEINEKNNQTNNHINTINGKLQEQQNEMKILRETNITLQRKIQELEHDAQIREERVDQLEGNNRRLQDHIKRLNDQSNKSESRLRHLEAKISQLLPHNNDELEDHITEHCEFGSQLAVCRENLTDRDVEIIVKRVVLNRQCLELDLTRNKITSQGALIIADAFHRDIRLRVLDLSLNHITDTGIQYLAEALLKNTTLKQLGLGSTGIINEGIEYLTEMLQINETLKKLYLDNNDFDDEGMKLLTNVLSRDNHTLMELSLGLNKFITDKSTYPMIDMFKQNRALDRIDLNQCAFSNGNKTRLRDAAENASIIIDI